MGIFNKKETSSTDKVKKEEIKEKKKPVSDTPAVKIDLKDEKLFSVLRRARITEKATDLTTDNNVYVFEVEKNSNKIEIAKAVEKFFGVKPKKIRVVKIPSKKVLSRGKRGVKSSSKKAYVYLKEGDKIENI